MWCEPHDDPYKLGLTSCSGAPPLTNLLGPPHDVAIAVKSCAAETPLRVLYAFFFIADE